MVGASDIPQAAGIRGHLEIWGETHKTRRHNARARLQEMNAVSPSSGIGLFSTASIPPPCPSLSHASSPPSCLLPRLRSRTELLGAAARAAAAAAAAEAPTPLARQSSLLPAGPGISAQRVTTYAAAAGEIAARLAAWPSCSATAESPTMRALGALVGWRRWFGTSEAARQRQWWRRLRGGLVRVAVNEGVGARSQSENPPSYAWGGVYCALGVGAGGF